MQLYVITSQALLLSTICFSVLGEDDKKKSRLQIGIKKRVEPDLCKIKSRKGDSLNMHYTVSQSSINYP